MQLLLQSRRLNYIVFLLSSLSIVFLYHAWYICRKHFDAGTHAPGVTCACMHVDATGRFVDIASIYLSLRLYARIQTRFWICAICRTGKIFVAVSKFSHIFNKGTTCRNNLSTRMYLPAFRGRYSPRNSIESYCLLVAWLPCTFSSLV